MRVMKFGGTSVGSREGLERVIGHVLRERETGPLAVVVSAQGHSTDALLHAVDLAASGKLDAAQDEVNKVVDLALSCAPDHAHQGLRELAAPLAQHLSGIAIVREATPSMTDYALSFGERLSATLLAALLEERRCPAIMVDSRAWTVTDDRFGSARVDWGETEARVRSLSPGWSGRVSVHTGFLGMTKDGRTTTLGRNGSDYTATLLARALGASEVVIWTDVSGVYTADPCLVDDAYPVPHLSYREAVELASLGLRMMHPRTMLPLAIAQIPLRIRNTMRPEDPGTLIDSKGSNDEERPACVTEIEDMALLDLQGNQLYERGIAPPRVLAALSREGIPVWLEAQAAKGSGAAIVVERRDRARAVKALQEEFARELLQGDMEPIGVREPVTLLTLVAEAMGRTPGVAGRFFGALGRVGVNVHASAQGASSRAISCVIDDEDTTVAVRTVHSAFNLAREQVHLLVLGKGTVGAHLLAQIAQQKTRLQQEHDVVLKVVGLADRKHVAWDERGIALDRYRELLEASPARELGPLLDRLRKLPVPVLVDCTAEDGMEALYEEAFRRGIHVVTANKKPLTVPLESYRRLHASARRHHRAFRYETTVGASLPVIDTLKNLVRTGDRVLLIEGSLSGTLGYLANELMAGEPLSRAVRRAKELGYTEPHPADDLSGLDAGRKAIILARELGLELSMSDVEVEPFVSPELLAERDVEAFFDKLAGADRAMAERIAQLEKEKRTLRYLARVEPGQRLRVGPIGVPSDHPAAHLRGSEAFVAFTTERYARHPLIVQGAGAGGAVTAAGVLADVFALSQALRGR
jgi:aspartokinase/homoserine dehydrogenase 1